MPASGSADPEHSILMMHTAFHTLDLVKEVEEGARVTVGRARELRVGRQLVEDLAAGEDGRSSKVRAHGLPLSHP